VFGSSARDTSRASRIADLIHHGRDEASIEVLLKNEGDGAYKHELYGDTIAITKRIRRGGAATVRMSNYATNSEVSRSIKDVKEMCEHYNILPSNPCVIMTQEVSKKFLQSKKVTHEQIHAVIEWARVARVPLCI